MTAGAGLPPDAACGRNGHAEIFFVHADSFAVSLHTALGRGSAGGFLDGGMYTL